MLSLVVNYHYINRMYHKTTSSVLQVYCSISVGNCLYTYGKLIVPTPVLLSICQFTFLTPTVH